MGAAASFTSRKDQGDLAFRSGQFYEAILLYTEHISGYEFGVGNEAEIDLAKVYCNRSAAYVNNLQYEPGLLDALAAIRLVPYWPKGYFRAAQAAMYLGESGKNDARDYIKKSLFMSPDDAGIRSLHNQLFSGFVPASRGLGYVFTWGAGRDGQLGHGSPPFDKGLPSMVDILRGKHIIDIACGAMHTICVSAVGEVFAWGSNTHSQCGLDNSASSNIINEPTIVSRLMGEVIVGVSCGAGHTVALTRDGRMYSWGVGRQGQLGHGGTGGDYQLETSPRLVEVLVGKSVSAVTCGIAHTMLLLESGDVYACGSNEFGQLGLGLQLDKVGTPSLVPLPLIGRTGTTRVSHIACGGAHSLVVDVDGVVYSTGSNSCGQLGLGHSMHVFSFTRMESLLSAAPCAYVSCGEEFSLAISRNRRCVFTWGLGVAGQMGNGDLVSISTPAAVEGLCGHFVEAAACSQGQVLLVTDGGEVWTWGLPGDRSQQALSDPSVIIRKPERVGTFSSRKRVRQLACGRRHYAIVTVGVYGPLCEVAFASDTFLAGLWHRFRVLATDIRGEACTSGGSVFTYRLMKMEAAVAKIDYGDKSRSKTNDSASVEIDDNMDGTYSGRFRTNKAGMYSLSVLVDGCPAKGSPFRLRVDPGPHHALTSSVHLKAKGWDDVHAVVQVEVNDEIEIAVSLRDKYGNNCEMPGSGNDDCIKIQILDNDGDLICQTSQALNRSGPCTQSVRAPALPGSYRLLVGLNTVRDDALIGGKPLTVVAVAREDPRLPRKPADDSDEPVVSRDLCAVSAPSTVAVDEPFEVIVRISTRESLGKYSISQLRSSLQCTGHSLSARALVRQCVIQPLAPKSGLLKPNSSSNDGVFEVRFVHKSRVAGEHNLVVTHSIPDLNLPNQLYVSSVEMVAGTASCEYSEIINFKDLQSEIESYMIGKSTLAVDASLVLRDAYGNPCSDCKAEVRALVTTDAQPIPDETGGDECKADVSVRSVVITERGHGVYELSLLPDPALTDVYLHVYLGAESILYSPFMLYSTTTDVYSLCFDELDVYDQRTLADDGSMASVMVPSKPLLQECKDSSDDRSAAQLRGVRQQTTELRAQNALRVTQSRRAAERALARRQQGVRRTGGGFLVQYSVDA